MKELKVKKIYPDAILPTRGTDDSAGADLYAYLKEPLLLKGGDSTVISTGIAIALEDRHLVGLVYGRSGLGIKHQITLSNCVGVIDADYRGELQVGLINHSEEDYTIQPGDRIAQLVITPILLPDIIEVDELPLSHRGDSGFGSTGR